MIRYRLKKDLPDCKAGTILTKEDKPDGLYMYCGVLDGTDADSWYIKEVVENNPDWFELIKEEPKEWEIVERVNNWKTMKEEIHSVKRISDGEVFTVGDDVMWNQVNHGRISAFEISPRNGKMVAKWFDGHGVSIKNITMSSKIKPKEVFTWDDEKVLAFARFTNSESTTFQGRYADLKEFKTKQSKRLFLPKERKYDPEYTFFRFTQQDLDKAREQTWEAARNYKSETPWFNDRPVYPTLESYLQTIKK